MPKGSDSSWAEKLYSKCGRSKHFEKPRFGTSAFLIHHFADLVQYETIGFLEKNRDTVIEEQVDVLRKGNVCKIHITRRFGLRLQWIACSGEVSF